MIDIQHNIVAATIWMEGSSEGEDGMQAIASTLGKRASYQGWMGKTLDEVCLMKDKHGIHQYSCWNSNDPNQVRINAVTANDPALVQAIAIARKLIAGQLEDNTNGADSYYRIGTLRPSWATVSRFRRNVEHHAFYLLGLDGTAAMRNPLPKDALP